jgi:hypothetical protein
VVRNEDVGSAPRRLTAVVVIVLLMAVACTQDAEQTPVSTGGPIPRGGILRIAGTSDVDYMDPAAMYYTVSFFLARGVLRTLVTYPAVANLEEQNQLAKRFKAPEDGTQTDAIWQGSLPPNDRTNGRDRMQRTPISYCDTG